MTGALSSFLGGSQQPQGQNQGQGQPNNTIDPNSILSGDFNPQDFLSADPTYQAEQTVPAGATPDPSTGAPSSPGAGQRVTDASTSGDLGSLRNLIMSASNQPQAGTPGIVRTPSAPGRPNAPGWFPAQSQGPMGNIADLPASAVGGQSYYSPYNRMAPQARVQAQAPAPAPAPAAVPEPVPLPQPRPADAPASFDERFGNLPPATEANVTPPYQEPYYDPGGAFGLGPERTAGTGVAADILAAPSQGTFDRPTTQRIDDAMRALGATSPAPVPPPESPLAAASHSILDSLGVTQPVPAAEAAAGPVQKSPFDQPQAPVSVDPATRSMTNPPAPAPAPAPTATPPTATAAPAPTETPAATPERQPAAPQQPQYTPEQYMQQFGPELLRDFLAGGPRGLERGLEDLIRQIMGRSPLNGGGQNARSRFVPFSNFSGKTQPKTVTPTRETPAATPVNLPATAGAQLDPFTAGTPATNAPGYTDTNFNSYARQVGQLESGGNTGDITGSNYGLYQFGPEEMRRYGITNWRDPRQQQRALQLETQENTQTFRSKLGRDPSPAELYIMHQQGVAGGPALIHAAEANPNMPAWQVIRPYYRTPNIAGQAIYGNIPNDNPLKRTPVSDITAADFVRMWTNRFNRGYSAEAA